MSAPIPIFEVKCEVWVKPGKMPDAREEAERIVDAGKLTDPGGRVIAVAAFEDLIAGIQKRTLLAAAEQVKMFEQGGTTEQISMWLERLADEAGRQ